MQIPINLLTRRWCSAQTCVWLWKEVEEVPEVEVGVEAIMLLLFHFLRRLTIAVLGLKWLISTLKVVMIFVEVPLMVIVEDPEILRLQKSRTGGILEIETSAALKKIIILSVTVTVDKTAMAQLMMQSKRWLSQKLVSSITMLGLGMLQQQMVSLPWQVSEEETVLWLSIMRSKI